MTSRSCMILVDVFPPVNTVGIHRTVALCRRLAAQGWRVTVITAAPGAGDPIDERLLDGVPKEVRVVRTRRIDLLRFVAGILKRQPRPGAAGSAPPAGAAPGASNGAPMTLSKRVFDWLSWWFQIPDRACGWFLPALWAGWVEARQSKPAVLYSSAPAWTCHVVAAMLSRLLGMPWVADFRDPWYGNPWRGLPYAAHRCWDEVLERWAVCRASGIACATEPIRRQMEVRYGHRIRQILAIHNGFDPEQIDPVVPLRLDEGRCVLIHAGTLYGPRSPVPLLEGMRLLQVENPDDAKRLLVVFMGLTTYNGRPMEVMAREHEVGEMVKTMPGMTHREALSYLKGADAGILFGQSGDASMAPVPAKVYEYIGAGKPVLAIEAGEEAIDVLRRGGCRLWTVGSSDAHDVKTALRAIVEDHRQGLLSESADPSARLAFTRARMAQRIESLLESAINNSR